MFPKCIATDLASERRALDVVVSELEVDDVEPRLFGDVGDLQLAVSLVVALDLRLAGALHGERHNAVACRQETIW